MSEPRKGPRQGTAAPDRGPPYSGGSMSTDADPRLDPAAARGHGCRRARRDRRPGRAAARRRGRHVRHRARARRHRRARPRRACSPCWRCSRSRPAPRCCASCAPATRTRRASSSASASGSSSSWPRCMLWTDTWDPDPAFFAVAAGCLLALAPPAPARPARRPPAAAAHGPHARATSASSPLVLALWAFALTGANLDKVAGLGLLQALPPIWFAAFALLLVGFAVALSGTRPRPLVLALYVLGLVALLHATALLLYDGPRFAWTYKHLGVTELIAATGHAHRSLDIYGNWPGFFAASAWLTDVGRRRADPLRGLVGGLLHARRRRRRGLRRARRHARPAAGLGHGLDVPHRRLGRADLLRAAGDRLRARAGDHRAVPALRAAAQRPPAPRRAAVAARGRRRRIGLLPRGRRQPPAVADHGRARGRARWPSSPAACRCASRWSWPPSRCGGSRWRGRS